LNNRARRGGRDLRTGLTDGESNVDSTFRNRVPLIFLPKGEPILFKPTVSGRA